MDMSRIEFELRSISEQLIILNERLVPLEHLCDCDVELLEVVDEC